MGVEKKRVAEDCVGAQDADLVCPLDWRLAVAADHFPDLADALSTMHSKGKPAFTRRIAAVAQQIGGAAVDLHRRNDAGEPPALVLLWHGPSAPAPSQNPRARAPCPRHT